MVRCDLLVVNKIDLAPHVGVDLEQMLREASEVRAGRPVVATNIRAGVGVDGVVEHLAHHVLFR